VPIGAGDLGSLGMRVQRTRGHTTLRRFGVSPGDFAQPDLLSCAPLGSDEPNRHRRRTAQHGGAAPI